MTDEPFISLDALAGICRYLIEKHQMNPRDLFNQLFALEPNQFLFGHDFQENAADPRIQISEARTAPPDNQRHWGDSREGPKR